MPYVLHYFPLQVTKSAGGTYQCSCRLFRDNSECLHVDYCKDYWGCIPHEPSSPPHASEQAVTLVKGAGRADGQSYYYVGKNPSTGDEGEFVRRFTTGSGSTTNCTSDRHAGGKCWHVQAVNQKFPPPPLPPVLPLPPLPVPNPVPITPAQEAPFPMKMSFHWPPTAEETVAMDKLRSRPNEVLQIQPSDMHGHLRPPPQPATAQCQCGQPACYELKATSNATVYLEAGPPTKVALYAYHSACGKGQCHITYDGHDDGLLVCSKDTVFEARILYHYGNFYAKAGIPQEGFFKAFVANISLRSSGNR
jgi:hypothetical protein